MSPRNFSEIRLSRIAAEPIVNGIGETSDIGEPTWPRYIRITDIRGLDELKSEERMSLPPTLAAKAKVERDDIVMAAVGATVGDAYIHQSDAPACFAGYLVRFRADRSLAHPRFVAHWTQSSHYRHQIRSGYVGSTIENFSASKYRAMRIPLPALSVQREISRFLDRETAKIDALIAKQNQLIATLREDRAATITQTVTKGLDPTTRMKASGVQWISEIPETWNVLRLSWMFATIASGTTPDSKNLNYYGGEINWVTTGELREGYVEKTTSRVTDLALADHSALRIYEPGSLVIAMYGATIGRLGILSAPACTNQACCVFSKPKQTDVRFIYYVLQAAREHLLVLASGGGQPNINQDKLRALRVPAPNFDTQRRISEYLDERCSKIDALIVKSTETIKVLREYRSALITNAVTGKIDVREAV